jgi:DNA-binding response OmpR family regulator
MRNHWFIYKNQKIELTKIEHIIVAHLRYKEVVTYDELSMALYGIPADKYITRNINVHKKRIIDKVPIKIVSIRGKGYMLKTEILFR